MDTESPISAAGSGMVGKLYIAPEDLKDRYRNEERGQELIKAYVASLQISRNIEDIEVLLKENKTVEFVISGSESQDVLHEVKEDIYGELCEPSSAKKYQQSSRCLPSATRINSKVSEEAYKEMNVEDQRQLLQHSDSKTSPLTMKALDAHDFKQRAGPCQLRQFGCPICMHSWWHNVLRSKPVSRCHGGRCGNLRYDALPKCKEFGIGRFLCPNVQCGRRFFGYCEATDIFRCRKCNTSSAMPYIHPKWKKRQQATGLNPRAKAFYPRFCNTFIKEDGDFHSEGSFCPLPAIAEDSGIPASVVPDADEDSLPDIGSLKFEDTKPDLVAESLSICSTTDISESNVSASQTGVGTQAEVDELSQASSDWFLPNARSSGTLSSNDSNTDALSQCSNASSSPITQPSQDQTLLVPEVVSQPHRRRIFNASTVHEPTGGTISTFLTQVDFQAAGEEVILDYDTDDDDEKVGMCKFECIRCENEYTVLCRMQDTAECFNCHASNKPLNWSPASWTPSMDLLQPNSMHNCSRCLGKGHCPNLLV